MGKVFYISEKELEVLEMWAKHGSLSAAAEMLIAQGKIRNKSTAYHRVNSLKTRYRAAKEFIREVERWFEIKLPTALEA